MHFNALMHVLCTLNLCINFDNARRNFRCTLFTFPPCGECGGVRGCYFKTVIVKMVLK